MDSSEHNYFDVFISYSRDGKLLMECVKKTLEDALFRVWVDEQTELSDSWQVEIPKILAGVGCVVYIATPESYHSEYVRAELLIARDQNTPIITVLGAGDKDKIIFGFNQSQYVDARSSNNSWMLKLIDKLYRICKRQLLYVPLRDIVSYFDSQPDYQVRAMIYRINKRNQRLYLHTAYGIFHHEFLKVTYASGEGLVGKVFEDGTQSYLLTNWRQYKEKGLKGDIKLMPEQIIALNNLGMIIALPIQFKAYLSPELAGDVTAVLVIDSPRSLNQLGLEANPNHPFIKLCAHKISEIAQLLDIEDGSYPVERLSC